MASGVWFCRGIATKPQNICLIVLFFNANLNTFFNVQLKAETRPPTSLRPPHHSLFFFFLLLLTRVERNMVS